MGEKTWYPCACGAEHDVPYCPFAAETVAALPAKWRSDRPAVDPVRQRAEQLAGAVLRAQTIAQAYVVIEAALRAERTAALHEAAEIARRWNNGGRGIPWTWAQMHEGIVQAIEAAEQKEKP